MQFAKFLRDGIRSGRIRCTVRVWTRLHVKVGGRYPTTDGGHVIVDAIETITRDDVTDDLARESGFPDAAALMTKATHGPGDQIYLIRFHYLAPGAWDTRPKSEV
ncbi:MAG TPA: hypothetical protein VMF13_19435 [Luteitalea sp.]|nr:hypothetical protein [Luteitalea sp.]